MAELAGRGYLRASVLLAILCVSCGSAPDTALDRSGDAPAGPPAPPIDKAPDQIEPKKWPNTRLYALAPRGSEQTFRFKDVTQEANAAVAHRAPGVVSADLRSHLAGVASGDLDADGFVDLFVVGGADPDFILHNQGDGTFLPERADSHGVEERVGDPTYGKANGAPLLFDFDGDGRLDLFVGGAAFSHDLREARLFLGDGKGSFRAGSNTGISACDSPVTSASAADYDLDGDLDLVTTHWINAPGTRIFHNSRGTFADGTERAGLGPSRRALRGSLAASFIDLDDDVFPELLVSVDFRDSASFANERGTLSWLEGNRLTDHSGMGTAFADFDGDLRLDFFVTATLIPDTCPMCDGNHLYQNTGSRQLVDMTEAAGVRDGGWGWAACAADLDLDGDSDLLHTAGQVSYASGESGLVAPFAEDRLRVFLNDGRGRFERADEELELIDVDQGRGLVCFDYDRDGDIDVFVQNHDKPSRLWRNELGERHSLTVALQMAGANSRAIGARIWLRTGSQWQVRDIRAGTNYASHDPAEAHFGLDTATQVDELWIRWPRADASMTKLSNLPVDHLIVVEHASANVVTGAQPPSATAPH